MEMSGTEYDVVVTHCGFDGSVAALRLIEKGCRGGVLEEVSDLLGRIDGVGDQF
jgi:hypothetical protein